MWRGGRWFRPCCWTIPNALFHFLWFFHLPSETTPTSQCALSSITMQHVVWWWMFWLATPRAWVQVQLSEKSNFFPLSPLNSISSLGHKIPNGLRHAFRPFSFYAPPIYFNNYYFIYSLNIINIINIIFIWLNYLLTI